METQPPVSRWRVVATAVRGQGHEKSGQPCQDAVAWQDAGGGVLIAAVADGAGSAKLGEVGSETAARAALAFLAGTLKGAAKPEDAALKAMLKSALEAALTALIAEAASRQAKTADLATTLLVCVASSERLAAAQVGDGAVVFADPAGRLTALTRPAAGEYLNETLFLTSEGALDRAQIETRGEHARQLALFSDGLQMLALKMPDAVPHAPFFKPLFAWLDQAQDATAAKADLEKLLRSPRVTERTDDDLTLLLATSEG